MWLKTDELFKYYYPRINQLLNGSMTEKMGRPPVLDDEGHRMKDRETVPLRAWHTVPPLAWQHPELKLSTEKNPNAHEERAGRDEVWRRALALLKESAPGDSGDGGARLAKARRTVGLGVGGEMPRRHPSQIHGARMQGRL